MDVAGLVLTGGASRRFGAPKADVRVDGERLADRSARVVGAVADPVLEVGPGRAPLDAVMEHEPGAGPLAAVGAGGDAFAARGAARDGALVAAVDLPFLDAALLRLLVATAHEHPASAAVVPRVDGRPQPLCAWYSLRALVRAGELVRSGARSMRALLGDLAGGVRWLDEAEWGTVVTASCFADVDTPADAHRFGLETPG